jgi:anaerobic selenocysteine-containing dehydrogenase
VKVSRRAFIQFTAGVVGGTLLSPLPWKLADDTAIWTQNWSWRPSPERGHVEKAATTCILCDGGCGLEARLVEGKRAILLEGNPASPVSGGGICPLGAAGLQFLYAPYRIPQPMRRTGPRGASSTAFQPISWDEALAELTKKLQLLKSDGKSENVACITDNRSSSMYDLWRQFMTAYGSPNLFKMPSHADSLKLASLLTMGQEAPLAFAIENASYILSFGANLAEGWCSPTRYRTTFAPRNHGVPGAVRAKLVQVEDRCSMTAAKADSWIAVSPGSEALLALAVAHVLIKENLYDVEFADRHVYGLNDWTDKEGRLREGFKNLVLKHYSPEQVADRTGVPAARIREVGREFGLQKRAVAVWGKNHGDFPENIYHDLSLLALNVLKGNLKPEGLVGLVPPVPLGKLPEVTGGATFSKDLAKRRLDLLQPKSAPLSGNGLCAFLNAVSSGAAHPIDMLMIHEANPAYSLPDGKLIQSALEKVGYIVSFSSYMDETTGWADLILPNSTAFERYDDVIGLPGTQYAYYAVATPILQPQLNTRHTGEVLFAAAAGLGESVARALPWKSYQEYLQERVKGLASSGGGAVADRPGTKPWSLKAEESVTANYVDGADLWKKLKAGHCWYDSPSNVMQGISTASGKVELACRLLMERGLVVKDDGAYLPQFIPPAQSGKDSEFPLLLAGYPLLAIAGDYLPNPPFMTKTLFDTVLKHNDSFVEINPQTAITLGLRQGERVKLETPRAEATVLVNLTQRARPGTVYIPLGLGHKAYDEYIKNKGANASDLIGVQVDPVTGLGTVPAARAKLSRA